MSDDVKHPDTPARLQRPAAFGDVFAGAARPAFAGRGFWQMELAMAWPDIVGTTYAPLSLPRSLRFPKNERTNGTLTIATTGAVALLMQHHVLLIAERINSYFGYRAVAGIRFQQVEAVYLQQLKQR